MPFKDDKLLKDLQSLRKLLHAHPELSGQESHTAGIVLNALEKCRPDTIISELGGTGVLALFDSGKAGPEVLLRCELDALPISEINNFKHQSRYPGVSHKCGHDGHMAILAGIARLLKEKPIRRGKLLLLFQPAEETGAGARAVIEDKKFQNIKPDFAFALHNLPGEIKHQILCKPGSISPAVKSLIFKLHGRKAHAAEPEKGISPALAIAEILECSSRLTCSDRTSEQYFLITPIYVNIGEKAYGIAAGSGELHFTIRTHSNEMMTRRGKEWSEQVRAIAQKHHLKLVEETTDEFRSNNNDPKAFEIVKKAAQKTELIFVEMDTALPWGEDFGLFTEKFRGALFGLGAGKECPALHQDDYDFPDELLESGIKIYDAILDQLLR